MSSVSKVERETVVRPIPVRAFPIGEGLEIVEIDIAGLRSDYPFQLDQIAAARALQRPLSSRRIPPLDLADASAPDGLIFHAGRCGSTLLAVALARLQWSRVVSEPGALNDVLSETGFWRFLPWPRREAALRHLMHLLPAGFGEDPGPLIVKMSSWTTREAVRFQTMWPGVPKLYLYREPLAALASFAARPPIWGRHAGAEGAWNFIARTVADGMSVIAEMVEGDPMGDWMLVNYAELADSVPAICGHFAMSPADDLVARFKVLARTNVKEADRGKAAAPRIDPCDPALEGIVEAVVRESYNRLEALRLVQKARPSFGDDAVCGRSRS